MPKKNTKRWVYAVLVATVFPALAVHVSCVAVLGPGTWGSGVEEKLPRMFPGESNRAVQAYALEFSKMAADDDIALPEKLRQSAVWKGDLLWTERLAEHGWWVLQTYAGKNWTEQQHVYLWRENAAELEEIRIPGGIIVERPTFIRRDDDVALAYERWHSWAIPAVDKLKRYARSWFDAELRPEFAIYTHDLDAGQSEFFGPGHHLSVSPGRGRGVFLRSGALGAGYYSIHTWEFSSGKLHTVLSLREADEGSGRSFDYRWSADSNAIEIKGMTGGFERRRVERSEFHLIYVVGKEKLYEID